MRMDRIERSKQMSMIKSIKRTLYEEYEEGVLIKQVETSEKIYELEDDDYDENM